MTRYRRRRCEPGARCAGKMRSTPDVACARDADSGRMPSLRGLTPPPDRRRRCGTWPAGQLGPATTLSKLRQAAPTTLRGHSSHGASYLQAQPLDDKVTPMTSGRVPSPSRVRRARTRSRVCPLTPQVSRPTQAVDHRVTKCGRCWRASRDLGGLTTHPGTGWMDERTEALGAISSACRATTVMPTVGAARATDAAIGGLRGIKTRSV